MIPQHYPVVEGKIYAGEYPGARSPEYAEARLNHLIAKGIRTFVGRAYMIATAGTDNDAGLGLTRRQQKRGQPRQFIRCISSGFDHRHGARWPEGESGRSNGHALVVCWMVR